MLLFTASRDPHRHPAGVRIPVRRTDPGKGGHHIDAGRIRHCRGIFLRLGSCFDHTHLVSEPLDPGACDKDTPLQRVSGFLVQPGGNGRDQPVLRTDRPVTGMHEKEAARAKRILDLPLSETALPEECRLLIPGAAGDRQFSVQQEGIAHAVHMTGWKNLRQHCGGNSEDIQQFAVPAPFMDIEQHRARSIGVIRGVNAPLGEIPDEPAVHGAERQLSRFRSGPCTLHMIQDPGNLGRGEIGIRHKSRFLPDLIHKATGAEFLDRIGRAPALPDNGIIQRLARFPIPDDRGLSLICDTDRGDILRHGTDLRHRFRGDGKLR